MSNKLNNKINRDTDFIIIIKDIVNNPEYRKIENIKHHFTTNRYTHCLNVSFISFRLAKLLNCDQSISARSGLLHDYYYEKNSKLTKKQEKIIKNHPIYALNNAKKYFSLNEIEENAILSHMYPIGKFKPKYKESWIVSIADKLVSINEKYYIFIRSLSTAVFVIFNWFMN